MPSSGSAVPSRRLIGVAAALSLAACSSAPSANGNASSGPPDPARIGLGERFRALGTEPFWSLDVEGDRLVWKTPDNLQGTPLTAAAREGGHDDGLHYIGAVDGNGFTLTLRREPCSDGMSDRQYAHSAIWRFHGETYRGCAASMEELGTPPGE